MAAEAAMRWAKDEVWIADLTGRVPWENPNATTCTEPLLGRIKLTWVSEEVVEGFAEPPRGSKTKLAHKTTLPTNRLVRRDG